VSNNHFDQPCKSLTSRSRQRRSRP
jgi:hypothetical protein